MPYYPAFLNLEGKKAVVVGGGRVAERKTRTLLRAGAEVMLVSPEATAVLARLAEKKRIRWRRRAFRRTDLAHAFVSVAATNSPAANRRVAEAAPFLLNVADDAERSNFIVPSSFRRGPVIVAVSTGGTSPAAAREIRKTVEAAVGQALGERVASVGRVRRRLKEEITESGARRRALRDLGRTVVPRGAGAGRSGPREDD